MVKRYDFDNDGNRMVGPDGIYVLASDYDALAAAVCDAIDQMDLTCMRAPEEISVAEGCPCPVCVLRRLAADGEVKC